MIMTLKKTTMSLVLLCCVFLISSCSSNNQDIQTNTEPYIPQEKIAIKALIDSIDMLNEKYPSVQTRGAFFTGGVVGLADAAGWAAGAGIGRWVGGAAGSLGGPATAVLGTFIPVDVIRNSILMITLNLNWCMSSQTKILSDIITIV